MRLKEARLAPLEADAWTDEQRALLAPLGEKPFNIFKTLARHPEAFEAFMAWGNYILSRKNTLPRREREIVILRIGFRCRAGYEWAQHAIIGKRVGLSDDEIARIKAGAGAGWGPADSALIRAADELHDNQFISPATLAALSAHFDEKQRMDVVFTAGQYTQVSMMLNTFGIQLDAG
ncbi:MAG: carboxymuconolactone decarboxylase family protein, partial [Hyphomonadaceae bacterium]